MKVIITSMLLMFFAALQAMPVLKDSTDNGKKNQTNTHAASPVVSNPSMSIQQLQEENALLKSKLLSLENTYEEEKGMLQYKLVMSSLISRIEQENKVEKIEDLKSQVNFTKVLSAVLLHLEKDSERK
jgi:hypothetical protein